MSVKCLAQTRGDFTLAARKLRAKNTSECWVNRDQISLGDSWKRGILRLEQSWEPSNSNPPFKRKVHISLSWLISHQDVLPAKCPSPGPFQALSAVAPALRAIATWASKKPIDPTSASTRAQLPGVGALSSLTATPALGPLNHRGAVMKRSA